MIFVYIEKYGKKCKNGFFIHIKENGYFYEM